MSKSNPEFCNLVVPSGGRHAMDKVCLGFQWGEPLDQKLMTEISSSVSGKSLLLPRKIEFSSGSVMKSEGDDLAEVLTEGDSELMGIIFDDNTQKDSPVDVKNVELLIQRDGLLFTIQSAVGEWADIKEQAGKVVSVLFDLISQYRKFNSVGLQVFNSLAITDENVVMDQVLKQSSDYLPRKVFQDSYFWNMDSHYFYELAEDSVHLNLEISLSPDDENRKLTIATLQRHIPNSQSIASMVEAMSRIDALYRENVKLVRSLIHDDVCDLIGMKKAGGFDVAAG